MTTVTTNETIAIKCPSCGAGFNNVKPDSNADHLITCPYCSTTLKFKPATNFSHDSSDFNIIIDDAEWIVSPRERKIKKTLLISILVFFVAGTLFFLDHECDNNSTHSGGNDNEPVVITEQETIPAETDVVPIICDGSKKLHIKNKNLSSNDLAVVATDNCFLLIENSVIKSNFIALRTRKHASVIVRGSNLSGKYRAMVSSGGSRIIIENSEFSSPDVAIVAKRRARVGIIKSKIRGSRFATITKNSGGINVESSTVTGRTLEK